MCAAAIIGLALVTTLVQKPTTLPPADAYGRIATLNGHGKIDPRPNVITEAFVEWGATQAIKTGTSFTEQRWVFEIASGMAHVSKRIVERGGSVLINDAEDQHLHYATSHLPMPESNPLFEFLPGWFPHGVDLEKLKAFFPIIGTGYFQAAHFKRASELLETVGTIWDISLPGARLFITYGTPWNGMFKGFPSKYRRDYAKWEKHPTLATMPGQIEDVHQYLPEDQYPKFFHALENRTMKWLLQQDPQRPWKILQEEAIQRPTPPEQAYRRGYSRGQAELMGMVLEKAAN
ncbi:hypothetical protein K2X33_11930 [bacterium]|nr:hypothetical protein [bacterium]